jgi:hypothetical protein
MKFAIKFICFFLFLGLWSSVSHAEVIFSGDFDTNPFSQVNLYNSTSISTNRPFSGNSHLQITTQNNSTKVLSSVQTLSLNAGKNYLISCYVDTRGVDAQLTFSCAGYSVLANANPFQIGYQLVVASLKVDQHAFGEFNLEISSSVSKNILMDDVSIVEIQSEIPVRPFATQPMANALGLTYDILEQIELDGVSIESNNRTTVDGYRLLPSINAALNPGISYELNIKTPNSDFDCQLLAWIDLNGNGVFDANESLNVTKTSAQKSSVQLVIPADFNANACIVRLRYLQANGDQLSTAISGNQWGETVDLVLGMNNQTIASNCVCTDPYYVDITGKRLLSLQQAPSGMYLYICGDCTTKTVLIRE